MDREWATGTSLRPHGVGDWRAVLLSPAARPFWVFLLLIVAAVLLRSPVYGNPDISLDEEFYLVVADRMMHGAVPYVDIWDRKPIGLFLIYAMTRLLGGDGFVQYQVVSSLFAGATAGFIWLIARRASSSLGSTAVALAYIVWLNLFSGNGGQSPVFYNLFMAMATWLAFRANDRTEPLAIFVHGLCAMALCGLVLQIKYTAVMESIFLGLWFLRRLWQSHVPLTTLGGVAILFGLIGIAPTAAVGSYYVAIGHWQDFAYANFWSVFDRGNLGPEFASRARVFFLLVTLPIEICLPFALVVRWQVARDTGRWSDFHLMIGWLLSACAGFAMIGNFYDHYFLPLLPPIFICVAPLLIRPLATIAVAAFLVVWPTFQANAFSFSYNQEKQTKIAELTDAVRPYVQKDCLFVFDGPAVLYMTTKACIPTRFVYPDHLSNDVEKNSIGLDATVALKQVLASRPGAIVTANAPVIPRMNQANLALMRTALLHDYRPVAAIDHPDRVFYVYARKDLARGPGMAPFMPYWRS